MKLFKNIMLVSFAALAMAACGEEEHEDTGHDHDNACDDHGDEEGEGEEGEGEEG